MDPNACFRGLRLSPTRAERAEYALDLLAWLARGGASPDGYCTNDVVGRCTSVLWDTVDIASAHET